MKHVNDKPLVDLHSTFVPSLILCGLNTPVCVQFLINKPEFTLGMGEQCDGVLSFNAEISRLHCRIIWNEGKYEVVDCGSTNCTYLNGEILEKDAHYRIVAGDQLQLATSTFQLEQIYTIPSEVV